MNPSVAGPLLLGGQLVARCSQYDVLKLFLRCCIHTREPERPGAFSWLVGEGIGNPGYPGTWMEYLPFNHGELHIS